MVWCLTVGCALACMKHEKRADRYPAQIFVFWIWLNLDPNTKKPFALVNGERPGKGFFIACNFWPRGEKCMSGCSIKPTALS